MSELDVPALAVSLALGLGGLAKLRAPAAAGPLLAALRLPAATGIGAALGAIEVVVAALAVAVGGAAYALVAALFAAFAVALIGVLRRGEAPSCGCFGRRSAPLHPVHVWIDAAAALVAATAALGGTEGLLTGATDGQPWAGVPLLALAVLGGLLVVATLTALPEAAAARQAASRPAPAPFHLAAPDRG